MRDDHGHGPAVARRHGPPGWSGPPFGPGRRFRRGAFVALLAVALLVAALATILASIFAGNAPAPGITVRCRSRSWRDSLQRPLALAERAHDRRAHGCGRSRRRRRLATRAPDTEARQLGRLTSRFNQMAERLETDERRRREMLADIAHELRTPLQVIRGSVEGMLDGLYPVDAERLRPLLDETIVMARLLDDLRTLSMAEAGVLELHRETIDPRCAGRRRRAHVPPDGRRGGGGAGRARTSRGSRRRSRPTRFAWPRC